MTSLFFWLGILNAAVGIPMALGRVPRNRWYGYRTRRTLADDGVWNRVNRASGKALIVGGVAGAALALLWGQLLPDIGSRTIANVVTMLVVLFGGIIWTEATTR